jgi:hypothetical protein
VGTGWGSDRLRKGCWTGSSALRDGGRPRDGGERERVTRACCKRLCLGSGRLATTWRGRARGVLSNWAAAHEPSDESLSSRGKISMLDDADGPNESPDMAECTLLDSDLDRTGRSHRGVSSVGTLGS